jgi:hypothetical protein
MSADIEEDTRPGTGRVGLVAVTTDVGRIRREERERIAAAILRVGPTVGRDALVWYRWLVSLPDGEVAS